MKRLKKLKRLLNAPGVLEGLRVWRRKWGIPDEGLPEELRGSWWKARSQDQEREAEAALDRLRPGETQTVPFGPLQDMYEVLRRAGQPDDFAHTDTLIQCGLGGEEFTWDAAEKGHWWGRDPEPFYITHRAWKGGIPIRGLPMPLLHWLRSRSFFDRLRGLGITIEDLGLAEDDLQGVHVVHPTERPTNPRGRIGSAERDIEAARLKDEEGWTYKQIGEYFGWPMQPDAYGTPRRCRTAEEQVRRGRRLRSQEIGRT